MLRQSVRQHGQRALVQRLQGGAALRVILWQAGRCAEFAEQTGALAIEPYAFGAWPKPRRFAELSTLAGRVTSSSGVDGLMFRATWHNHRAARARTGLIRDQTGSAGRRASRSAEAVS